MSRRDPNRSAPRVEARRGAGDSRRRAWALVFAAAVGMAFKLPYWGLVQDLDGTIVLSPDEPASLRFRTAMENELGVSYWWVGLRVNGLSGAGGGSTVGGGLGVRVNGQVVGDTTRTCEIEIEREDSDTGAPEWIFCDLELTCADGASSCEAVVEYQLQAIGDAPVTVEWAVRAGVDGATSGCCQRPDEVEGSVDVELLD